MNKDDLFKLAMQLLSGVFKASDFAHPSRGTIIERAILNSYNTVLSAYQKVPETGHATVD